MHLLAGLIRSGACARLIMCGRICERGREPDEHRVSGPANFQVTVVKILVSYHDGFATLVDLKRDMAILATGGRDWTERTKRLAARMPDLDIFSQDLVERQDGGWRITEKGRSVLEMIEARPATAEAPEPSTPELVKAPKPISSPVPPAPTAANLGPRERRRRRRQGIGRRRANASWSSRAALEGSNRNST